MWTPCGRFYLLVKIHPHATALSVGTSFDISVKPDGIDTLQLQELEEDDAFYEAITSLGWRSLIEKNDSGKFFLQPVVREHVTKQLVKLVTDEILNYQQNKNLNLLVNYDFFAFDNTSTTVTSTSLSEPFGYAQGKLRRSNQKEVHSILSLIKERLNRKVTSEEINLILQDNLPKRVKENLTNILAEFNKN